MPYPLPFVHYARADFSTVVAFAVLGPMFGLLVLGLQVNGIDGALTSLFLFLLSTAFLPQAASLMMVMLGMIPACCAALGALAFRGFDKPLLFCLGALMGGLSAEYAVIVAAGLAEGPAPLETMVAAGASATLCSALTYPLRRSAE